MARPVNEAERHARLAEVDTVVRHLRTVGEKITRRKIAEDLGLTVQAMYVKDHDGNRNYLAAYVDRIIDEEKMREAEAVGDVVTYAQLLEEARNDNIKLNKKLTTLQRQIDSLTKDNSSLQDKIIKLQLDLKTKDDIYQHLLETVHKMQISDFQRKQTRID